MSEEQKEQKERKEELVEGVRFESLLQALDAEKKRSEDYLTRLKYVQADFENLKKRFDRQVEEVKKYCTENLIVELLNVVDELELAVKSGRSSNSAEVLVQGVEMTLKKLKKVLEQEGVFPIEAVGKPFDPSKHDAVARIEKNDVEGYVVVEEVRKGYIMKDKVIRPSIVKITVPYSNSQREVDENEQGATW